jgi:TPR repeat protein
MTKLGTMHLYGRGTPVNYAEAITWFRKAAELDHGLAMAYLGTMYRDGLGVAKDRVQAVEWLRKAAARDCLWAADELRKLGHQP